MLDCKDRCGQADPLARDSSVGDDDHSTHSIFGCSVWPVSRDPPLACGAVVQRMVGATGNVAHTGDGRATIKVAGTATTAAAHVGPDGATASTTVISTAAAAAAAI